MAEAYTEFSQQVSVCAWIHPEWTRWRELAFLHSVLIIAIVIVIVIIMIIIIPSFHNLCSEDWIGLFELRTTLTLNDSVPLIQVLIPQGPHHLAPPSSCASVSLVEGMQGST